MKVAALDEEPGVVLVDAADVLVTQRGILAKSYQAMIEGDGLELVPGLRESFFKVCRLVATVGKQYDQSLFRQLAKPTRCPDAGYASRLRTLCKCHKPPGEVTLARPP